MYAKTTQNTYFIVFWQKVKGLVPLLGFLSKKGA
jgi:hypothetical protein